MSMRVVFKPKLSMEAINKVMSEELERFYADDTAEELDQDECMVIKEAQDAKRDVNIALRDQSVNRYILPLADTEEDFYRAYSSLTDTDYECLYESDDGETYILHGNYFVNTSRIVKIRAMTSQGRALFEQWRRGGHWPFADTGIKTYEDFRKAAVDEKYSQSFSLSSLMGERLESIEKYATV